MKLTYALLLVVTAALSPAAPLTAPPVACAEHAALAGPEHPIRMSGQGLVLGDPTAPGGAPFVAQGVSTLLGAWTNVGVLEIDPATGAATGSVTFTAANGDLLHATFVGVFDPGTGTATATFDWAGGTGRFAAASGAADFVVAQDPTGPFDFEAFGSIDL